MPYIAGDMRTIIYIAAWWLAGCGGSTPTEPYSPVLLTQVHYEGLAGTVRVDSVFWDARGWTPTAGNHFEISGRYALTFRNLADQPLEVRYDLRFLDLDGFFIDVFNPFNLPLRLAPGQAWRDGGDYTIRADDPRALDLLQTMLVHVVAQAAQTEIPP